MRALVLVALAVMLALVPGGAAHAVDSGTAQTHLTVKIARLESGANESVAIETGEGPWQKGMIFIFYTYFSNATGDLQVDLVYNHSEVVKSWRLSGVAAAKAAAQIPHDVGPYELVFTNRGVSAIQYAFFFDQTCNCTTKFITLPGGFVVFRYDLEAGRKYSIGYPLANDWKAHAEIARLVDARADYPTDFATEASAAAEAPRWMNLTFSPKTTGQYYVFITEEHGVKNGPDGRPIPLELTALFESAKAKSSALSVAAVVVGSAMVLALLGRRT